MLGPPWVVAAAHPCISCASSARTTSATALQKYASAGPAPANSSTTAPLAPLPSTTSSLGALVAAAPAAPARGQRPRGSGWACAMQRANTVRLAPHAFSTLRFLLLLHSDSRLLVYSTAQAPAGAAALTRGSACGHARSLQARPCTSLHLVARRALGAAPVDRYSTCTGAESWAPSGSSRHATSRAVAPFRTANGLPRSRACFPCRRRARCIRPVHCPRRPCAVAAPLAGLLPAPPRAGHGGSCC